MADGPEASCACRCRRGGGRADRRPQLDPFTVPGDESRTVESSSAGGGSASSCRRRIRGIDRSGCASSRGQVGRSSSSTCSCATPLPHEHGIDDERRLGVHLRSLMVSPDRAGGR
jgi:hypothetical protein